MNQVILYHVFRKQKRNDKVKGAYFVYEYQYSSNDIVAVRETCKDPKGEYVYTFSQAWFGSDD